MELYYDNQPTHPFVKWLLENIIITQQINGFAEGSCNEPAVVKSGLCSVALYLTASWMGWWKLGHEHIGF